MSNKCKFPDGFSFKPDGINEAEPCTYNVVAAYKNVTIYILQCERCGDVEILWKRQDNTEDIPYDGVYGREESSKIYFNNESFELDDGDILDYNDESGFLM